MSIYLVVYIANYISESVIKSFRLVVSLANQSYTRYIYIMCTMIYTYFTVVFYTVSIYYNKGPEILAFACFYWIDQTIAKSLQIWTIPM